MDDILFLAHTYEATLLFRYRVDSLLTRLLGLLRSPKKGIWTPT
jgi:hypothetical protein